ncbi:MAG: Hsp33 family molecular chaperone HslO [Deltaproteobacteria bacterium]|nr:Hsp33 family molecular chaperone HslO [Deltaproteobacteria bacterium]
MTTKSPTRATKIMARGHLRVGLAAKGQLRWAVADLSEIVEAARQRRDLSPVASVALGQMLAGAALILRLQSKTPVRVILESQGDGPLGRVTAEADDLGHLRGSVTVPQAVVPTTGQASEGEGIDSAAGIGKGNLKVIRQMPNITYESVVPLLDGQGVSQQLTHFLQQSDQTQSALLLGVLLRSDGVAAAGGLILEALPGADEDLVNTLEGTLSRLPSVSRCLEEKGVDGLLAEVFGELDRKDLESLPLAYVCTCDRERLRLHLAHLPAEDRDHLLEMKEEGQEAGTEVECNFCGAHYRFSAEELSIPQ